MKISWRVEDLFDFCCLIKVIIRILEMVMLVCCYLCILCNLLLGIRGLIGGVCGKSIFSFFFLLVENIYFFCGWLGCIV